MLIRRKTRLEELVDQCRARDHARRLSHAVPVDLDAAFAAYPTRDALEADLRAIVLRPVLTSHPSEMRPPAVLAALASADDEASALAALAYAGPQLNEQRPSVGDEVETLLGHFERSLVPAVADHHARVTAAVLKRFGGDAAVAVPSLHFHSWVGCDRDGNPFVTAAATLDTARRMRALASEQLRACIAPVAAYAAVHLPAASPALHIVVGSIAADDGSQEHRTREIAAMITALEAESEDPQWRRAIARLRSVHRVFGAHLATLEWRQHSDFILRARDEWHAVRRDELSALSRESQEVLASLHALAEIRRHGGAEAVGELIISNCEDAEVVFALDDLARDAGVFELGEIAVVPLFESVAALSNGPRIVETLLKAPAFREKIRKLDDRFEIMVGYSDAAKDGGRLAADLLIEDTQIKLTTCCARHGVMPLFFHGRGGSLGRGAASIAEAARPADPRLPAGELKWTEQGEVVANRYGHLRLAAHTLDTQLVEALAASQRARAPQPERDDVTATLLADLSAADIEAFRSLREHPAFMDDLRALTALDTIRGMPFSSRPASRDDRQHGPIELAQLRAVPFNMAFNLAFAPLPTWFGTGSALAVAAASGRLDLLRHGYMNAPVFRAALERARAALALTDLRILRERATTLGAQAFVARAVRESEILQKMLVRITGQAAPYYEDNANEAALAELLAAENLVRAQTNDEPRLDLILAGIAAILGTTG